MGLVLSCDLGRVPGKSWCVQLIYRPEIRPLRAIDDVRTVAADA